MIRFGFAVLNTYPHDPKSYTQGLVYREGKLYESTGRYGRSALRKIDLAGGTVEKQIRLSDRFFGEGLAIVDHRLIQLTWNANTAIVYNLDNWAVTDQFFYKTQGWGLTWDGSRLIMSDGSSRLFFRDPLKFRLSGVVQVTQEGVPVKHLNELESVKGYVFANVWKRCHIVIIDPESGRVRGFIQMERLCRRVGATSSEAVLNGIAYHSDHKTLLITGKLWPRIFEIGLVTETEDQ